MRLKLHTYFRSSAAYRARIALHLKGLDYDAVLRHLRRREHRDADFLALNPQGLLPVLEHDGLAFAQSLAIIEYLEERWPEPPLLPSSREGRAIVRAMAQVVACEIHPLCNLRVLEYLKTSVGCAATVVDQWYRHWVAEGLGPLERLAVKNSGDGEHCYGDTVTLADVCLVPQLHNARRFGCDLEPYPTLRSIDASLRQQAAFVAARPDNQPDAEP